jgi:hypothetical protein
MHCVIAGLRDPELPVRVDSVFALRSFVEACKDLDEIRPILPQLLDGNNYFIQHWYGRWFCHGLVVYYFFCRIF